MYVHVGIPTVQSVHAFNVFQACHAMAPWSTFVSIKGWLVVGLRRGWTYRKNRQDERRLNPMFFRLISGFADKIRWYWYPR